MRSSSSALNVLRSIFMAYQLRPIPVMSSDISKPRRFKESSSWCARGYCCTSDRKFAAYAGREAKAVKLKAAMRMMHCISLFPLDVRGCLKYLNKPKGAQDERLRMDLRSGMKHLKPLW